jgi:hypothetical protein
MRSRPSRRGLIAMGVLGLWIAGLGFLARQELFRPRLERLTEAGLRINQYTSFFGLRAPNKELVGYASSIVDTTLTDITIHDEMIRELSVRRRAFRRAKTHLTRTFKLKDFEWRVNTGTVDMRSSGRVEGDSLIYTVQTNTQPPTSGVIKLDGPVLVPNLVPHAVILMDDPKVGRKYTLPVFDPTQLKVVQVKTEIQRETTFVLSDSSVIDTVSREWKSVRSVPVKAFWISSSPGGINGWVDETGHVIQNSELDAEVLRGTIEESFENWMVGVNRRRRAAGLLPPVNDSVPAPPRTKKP